jgi:hypothetical protein
MADGKDFSSGLLISVVRNLTTSQSIDQKDIAKQRLEQGHLESVKKLDKLLSGQS